MLHQWVKQPPVDAGCWANDVKEPAYHARMLLCLTSGNEKTPTSRRKVTPPKTPNSQRHVKDIVETTRDEGRRRETRSTATRQSHPHEGRQRETKGDKGRPRETKGDKGRQRETKGDKGRQRETNGDKGSQEPGNSPQNVGNP